MSQSNHIQNQDLPLHVVDVKEYPPDASALKGYAPSTAGNSLNERSSSSEESQFKVASTDDNLPPVDGGLYAWLFLLASSMLEAIVWGELSLHGRIGSCLHRSRMLMSGPSRICLRIWYLPRIL